jgi:RimJ/RimL family protein N-acetyltransferase
VKTFEFSWILEDNLPTRQLAEALGAKPVQTLRLYEKHVGE